MDMTGIAVGSTWVNNHAVRYTSTSYFDELIDSYLKSTLVPPLSRPIRVLRRGWYTGTHFSGSVYQKKTQHSRFPRFHYH
jgi:hypothetical protein